MTEPRDWFKVWAAKSLLSDDLNSLTEHQERIFWRLMMKASLEEDRWHIAESPGLIAKCMTTPAKFASALEVFAKLEMVLRDEDGRLFVVNGRKWNEDTERPRKPSDNPEAVRERVTRHRHPERNADETPPVTRYETPSKRDVTPPPLFKRREEKREEEEEEKRREDVVEGDDDGIDSGFRKRYGTMTVAFGGRLDRRLADEFEQAATELTLEEIMEAIAKCRSENVRCWPREIRARVPKPLGDDFAARKAKFAGGPVAQSVIAAQRGRP